MRETWDLIPPRTNPSQQVDASKKIYLFICKYLDTVLSLTCEASASYKMDYVLTSICNNHAVFVTIMQCFF